MRLIVPVELPPDPVSCCAAQLLRVCKLPTLIAPVGITGVEATVMATSVTQEEPLLPHALTCRVCDPVPEATMASTDGAYTMVVSVLLSSE